MVVLDSRLSRQRRFDAIQLIRLRRWPEPAPGTTRRINQPFLFVAGEDDTVVRDICTGAFNALEQTMPGLTKMVRLPRTGH
jgi:pimeloyl-ACP methyl ester carboxylesterase